jgi:Icc-related predicted phosphoesterase
MPAMSIYVVSDLHGAAGALRKAVPEDATLLLLGDLLNFVDYRSMTGILVDVFSKEAVGDVIALRAEGRFDEARAAMRHRSAGREEEVRGEIGRRSLEQYREIFASLPRPTYMILGNVDIPPMAALLAAEHEGVTLADGRVITLEGQRFGFVGGALPTPLKVAGEISREEMRAKVEALGETDVLCSHIPPSVPDLCWDTLAGRAEQGSEDLLRYIEDVQPERAYFGHVHQPLVSTLKIGRTLCINVGFFRTTERAFPHSKEDAWQTP